MVFGLWPRLNYCRACCWNIFGFLIFCGQVIPQTMAAINYRNDLKVFTESVLALIVVTVFLVKVFYCLRNWDKVIELLNRIHTDWQVWAEEREVEILHDYAEYGKKLALTHFVGFISMSILMMFQPAVPKIIDILLKNGSKPGALPIALDYYYFDVQEYYFYVIAHCVFSTTLGFFVVMPFDCMFIVSLTHASGLFSALNHKLITMGNDEDVSKIADHAYLSEKGTVFEYLTWCIKRHNTVIEYANLIESTFTWSLFYIVGLNMLVISISGYQIARARIEFEESFKFLIGFTAGSVHIGLQCLMAQGLIDHSSGVSLSIYCSQWENKSPKIQKLIYFMMQRCYVSCNLTAGKILIVNLETFAGILKSSVSFLTILRSI